MLLLLLLLLLLLRSLLMLLNPHLLPHMSLLRRDAALPDNLLNHSGSHIRAVLLPELIGDGVEVALHHCIVLLLGHGRALLGVRVCDAGAGRGVIGVAVGQVAGLLLRRLQIGHLLLGVALHGLLVHLLCKLLLGVRLALESGVLSVRVGEMLNCGG